MLPERLAPACAGACAAGWAAVAAGAVVAAAGGAVVGLGWAAGGLVGWAVELGPHAASKVVPMARVRPWRRKRRRLDRARSRDSNIGLGRSLPPWQRTRHATQRVYGPGR